MCTRRLIIFLALALAPIFTFMFALTSRVEPAKFYLILDEDQFAEWVTFGFLMACSALSCVWFVRLRRTRRRAWFAAFFACFAFFAAMEEISWGQRVVDMDTPEFFATRSDQPETNLHNLVQGQFSAFLTKHIAIFALGGYFVILPLLARLRPIDRWVERLGLHVPSLVLAPAVLIASVANLELFTKADEEFGELVFSMCLFFVVLMALVPPDEEPAPRRRDLARAVALLLASLMLVGATANATSVRKPKRVRAYLALSRAAATLPDEGLVLTHRSLAGWLQERTNIVTRERWDGSWERIGAVFEIGYPLEHTRRELLRAAMMEQAYGVRHFDGRYIVLQRGAPSPSAWPLLRPLMMGGHVFLVSEIPHHRGIDRQTPDAGVVRYWDGNGSRSPANLAHGKSWKLEPGRYRATLAYRAEPPRRAVRKTWGWFSLHRLASPDALAEAHLPQAAGSRGVWQEHEIVFDLNEPADIEPRVTGADAALWLHHVRCEAL